MEKKKITYRPNSKPAKQCGHSSKSSYQELTFFWWTLYGDKQEHGVRISIQLLESTHVICVISQLKLHDNSKHLLKHRCPGDHPGQFLLCQLYINSSMFTAKFILNTGSALQQNQTQSTRQLRQTKGHNFTDNSMRKDLT